MLVAIRGDFDAAHQFHDEIRAPGERRAGIEHLCNIRMVHYGQRLPLGFEPRDDVARVHAKLDDLQRDAAADRLLLLGHINYTAAPFTELLKELVVTDAVAWFFGDR